MIGRQVFARLALGLFLVAASSARAQERQQTARSDAPLVVEGTVRQTYQSKGQGPSESLLMIEVHRCQASRSPGALASIPAPGESVYVHVPGDQVSRPQLRATAASVPAEGEKIRASLSPRNEGGWQAAGPDWYERLSERPSGVDPTDLVREAVEHSKRVASFGMTTELLNVDGRFVLRVISLERNGAAQSAGLEVGDVIVSADGTDIASATQLAELAAKNKKVSLIVIDVNTGRGARVEIDPKAATTAATNDTTLQPGQPARVSLGISAEPVSLGGRSALKVTRVDPAGPAAKAGLEPGDIVVAANGAPITGVEQLLAALRKSGPTLNLTVRDSRTSRDTEVAVNLDNSKPAPPKESETPIGTPSGRLGAVTELAFHDTDFAVKITEVEPGSAAARAGLRPGVLIIAANGKPVLHPNDLNDAIRTSGNSATLTVVEPTSGRKSNVSVALR